MQILISGRKDVRCFSELMRDIAMLVYDSSTMVNVGQENMLRSLEPGGADIWSLMMFFIECSRAAAEPEMIVDMPSQPRPLRDIVCECLARYNDLGLVHRVFDEASGSLCAVEEQVAVECDNLERECWLEKMDVILRNAIALRKTTIYIASGN